MRTVKHRSHPVECNPNTRAASFGNFRATGLEKGFDVSPVYSRQSRIGKNRIQHASMLLAQLHIVSLFSIVFNIVYLVGSDSRSSIHNYM